MFVSVLMLEIVIMILGLWSYEGVSALVLPTYNDQACFLSFKELQLVLHENWSSMW